jgi:hypothetical protein
VDGGSRIEDGVRAPHKHRETMENETEEKKGWRRWLVRALFESALIILSIIAALAVNEWRDQRELESHVRRARVAFAQEIQANSGTLLDEKTGLPYHRRLWKRYQELGAKPVITVDDLRPLYEEFPHGINMLRLRDAVWRSLSGSDLLRRLDQHDLFLLAEIYRQQEEIDDFNRAMYNAWRQVDSEAESPGYIKDGVRSTRAYLADIIAAEERLKKLYETAAGQFGRAEEK